MRRMIAIACVLGCHREDPPPPVPAPAPAPIAPIAIDAAVAPDAAVAVAPCDAEHRFKFGTLTAPAGWCWYRLAEGDDLSGELHDPNRQRRARFTELAFDAKVGDPCAAAPEQHVRGVAYRSCAVDSFRHCVTFHGLANLCTIPPEEPDLSLAAIVATLRVK